MNKKAGWQELNAFMDILDAAEEIEWELSPTHGRPDRYGFTEKDDPKIEAVISGIEMIKKVVQAQLELLEKEKLEKWQ